jgi:hypothetical protein
MFFKFYEGRRHLFCLAMPGEIHIEDVFPVFLLGGP